MTITAKFSSRCPSCGGTIAAGELVEWRRGEKARHVSCEAPEDVRIEFPAQGATYCHQEFGVYRYGVYERSSVLAGQESRQFLGSYDTEAEAREAHPEAAPGVGGCGYRALYLGHLPDPDGPDPLGDNEDAYRSGLADARGW